jgi:hypothetical protein
MKNKTQINKIQTDTPNSSNDRINKNVNALFPTPAFPITNNFRELSHFE